MNAQTHLLSVVLFLPLAGACAALLLRERPGASRAAGMVTAVAELAVTAALPLAAGPGPLRLVEDAAWITRFHARYTLVLDGLSWVLLLMSGLLFLLAVLVSRREAGARPGLFIACLLAIQSSAAGVFLARDLLLFYLFWEVQLIPMFLLIGAFGHEDSRRAAVKFFLFGIAGGLCMLLAVIGLYLLHGQATGAYTLALDGLRGTPVGSGTGLLLFAAFVLAFGVKLPVVPLHTWLPDAHTQAPAAGSLILAGVLLKTGAYGLLRWAVPLFPTAASAAMPVLLALGLAGLFYASCIAFAQTDAKRLVAYSSIGHMGLVVLALAVWNRISLSGAALQMVNHALSTGALFVMLGMLSERAGTREMSRLGGAWKRMPVFSGFFLLFAMASAGLPGLNNFVSELLVVVGAFKAAPWAGGLAFCAMVLTLAYVLRLVRRTLFGQAPPGSGEWADVDAREVLVLVLLAVPVIGLGLFPGPVLDLLRGPVAELAAQGMMP